MKIYTKGGDGGTTSLFGGERVDKDNLRVEAYGNLDELNALIGAVISNGTAGDISKKLERVQNELFVMGSDLATPIDVKLKMPRISRFYVTRLEREIDWWEKSLPKLTKFILPGGSQAAAKLHLARTVARRAERSIVALAASERINKFALVYINRLSDWLFVSARYVNKEAKAKEIIWQGRPSKKK